MIGLPFVFLFLIPLLHSAKDLVSDIRNFQVLEPTDLNAKTCFVLICDQHYMIQDNPPITKSSKSFKSRFQQK